jgi:hypothetical protein
MANRQRFEADQFDVLATQIAEVRRLARIANQNPRPTVPIYTVGSEPADLINGQVWIGSDNKLYYRSGGTTREAGQASPTAYTPVWTQNSVNPSLGNGSIAGRYIQIGKLVVAGGTLTFGSTTSTGTGLWIISLPVVGSANFDNYGGHGIATDNGVANYAFTPQRWNQNGIVFTYHSISAAGQYAFWNNTGGPFSPGNGDYFQWQVTYEAL